VLSAHTLWMAFRCGACAKIAASLPTDRHEVIAVVSWRALSRCDGSGSCMMDWLMESKNAELGLIESLDCRLCMEGGGCAHTHHARHARCTTRSRQRHNPLTHTLTRVSGLFGPLSCV
jgi:hypothetical protein